MMPTPDVPKEDNSGELSEDEASFILDSVLKPKHRRDASVLAFIESFVRCQNLDQASAECNLHKSVGYRYRHTKDIALCIQKLIDRGVMKYGFDGAEIVARTKEMVDFDPIDVYNPDGTFKKLHEMSAEARRCIKKLKVKNLWGEQEDMNGIKKNIIIGEVIEYEFYDKQKAIELVGKEKELFKTTTRVEHDVTKDMRAVLLASAERGKREAEKVTFKPSTVIDVTPTEVVQYDEETP